MTDLYHARFELDVLVVISVVEIEARPHLVERGVAADVHGVGRVAHLTAYVVAHIH